MKLHKIVYLVALTAAAFAMVGCKKGLQGTTPLPGYGMSKPPGGDDKPQLPIGIGDGNVPRGEVVRSKPIETSSGIQMSGKINDWVPSAEQPFKSDTVFFEFDKSTIKQSEIPKLDRVATEMKQRFQGKGLRIEGHCDERGTEEYNRSLGDRRALSVREYLVRAGLNFELVDTVSYGEDRPAVPGHTEAAFSKNRRAEFILLEPPK
jgi:peptidoglycan-associated lipoprotein